ncbi:hypothetical protein [Pedobacter sp. MC2016-24]|uniref:hypothetical protein n=1 Tax=Pedobacter sp. MC2016-24 TaxID=2780090 RepID=UPI00187F4CB8|nr:hypothetical protein [Pedobacter sp. MC2016-24]MBE9601713.1 hypothetical protein [Pedobacter sp. MC2016-24]
MKKILSGCALLILFLCCSCNSLMKNDFENEHLDKLGKANQRLSTMTNPWDTIPSPLSWIQDREGTGPYQPTDPNYLYVGDNPDYKLDNNYSNYIHFYWHGFPSEGPDYPHLAADYKMQIQWRYGDDVPWSYIYGSPGYGLTGIRYTDVLEDLPAYAFPYSESGSQIRVRIRVIHKDFLTLAPDFDAYDLYDRSLVSPWSSELGSTAPSYYNYWGYGRPQPQQTGGGGWTDADPNDVTEGQILVSVYLPTVSGYSFSYEIENLSGGLTQTIRDKSPNFLGVGKNKMIGIGSSGGRISVHAKCSNTLTHNVSYTTKMMSYGLGEKTLDIFFSENDFDISE